MARKAILAALLVNLVVFQGCTRVGFGPGGQGGDGGSDGPFVDSSAQDFGVQSLTQGGSADPNWSGASTGSGTTVEEQAVVLTTEQRFAIKTAKLLPPRAWAATADLGDLIFVFGGATNTTDTARSTQIQAYDPDKDVFTSAGTLTRGLSMSAAVAGSKGLIYLVKGLDKDTYFEDRVQRFDPTTQTLVELPALNLIIANRHAAVIVGDLIHIFGGYGTGPIRHEIQTYNVTTQKVATLATTMSSVGGGRTRLRACGAANGKIYIFGGTTVKGTKIAPESGDGVVPDILAYTPSSGALAKVGSLPVPLMNTAVGLMPDGKIYIVGGDTPTTSPACKRSDAVYIFDPVTNKVTTPPALKLPFPLSGAAFAVHAGNKKLYLFGGRDNSANGLSDEVLELFPYSKQGEVRGPVLDTGGEGSVWIELDWKASTTTSTRIDMAVRASDSTYLQGDSTPAWQAVSAPPPAKSQLPKGRYLQWRATLTTSNSALTPALQGVTLRYQRLK